MEKELLEYMALLREFGRIYTQRIIDGNPRNKADLKLSQIKALSAFRRQDCFSMKELAANIGVKLPNMTMMIDSMEKEGYVERERDAGDRRKVIVWLTPKGKKLRTSFLSQRHKIARSVFSHLDDQEKQQLMESLQNVCMILEKSFKKDLK